MSNGMWSPAVMILSRTAAGRATRQGSAPTRTPLAGACAVALVFSGVAHAQSAAQDPNASRLDALQHQVDAQARRIGALEHAMSERDDQLAALQRTLDRGYLDQLRARGVQDTTPAPTTATTTPSSPASFPPSYDQTPPERPVGKAPDTGNRPPEVARIFEEPSVLTPKGHFILEPSLQFGYSATDRVALVGYTVIPAILIGLIDVRQVKTTTETAALTLRYGLTKRLELEARVPYSHINTDTISREVFTGTAQDRVFTAGGSGIGDVELAARYQFSEGSLDKPFYVGWLRYKSRTGKDPFEVVTDCVQRCIGSVTDPSNTTGTGLPLDLPTGSGFQALQGGVTWLYASDPAVLFGSFSYLHNFPRHNVSRHVLDGRSEFIGDVDAGDIIGFNLGMGLSLNERFSLSLGYDQSFVGRTRQNGVALPGSARVVLGTLLIGGSYRFSDLHTVNFSLGIGVTRDTPDVTLTVRTPFSL